MALRNSKDDVEIAGFPSHGSSREKDMAQRNPSVSLAAPKRTMSLIDCIGAGWVISQSWAGLGATMAFSIYQGGPVTVVYGMILILFTMGSTALSLAELSARYPTSGGQYHWTAILSPSRWRRGTSYICGCINMFSWISISAGVCILPCQMITAVATFFHPNYLFERWHIFLEFQAFNVMFLLFNIYIIERAQWIHTVGFVGSIIAVVVIFITCLATSSPKSSSEYVWTQFVNPDSGWPNGVVFLTGLVSPNYMYVGIDGAIHLAEECVNATIAVPRTIVLVIVVGFLTAFPFGIAMLYSVTDWEAILTTPTGVPIYQIFLQATKSAAGGTVIFIMMLVFAYFALIASMQSASRLTWSFARDDAIIFSRFFSQIHPTLNVPVWALLFNSSVMFLLGCIYLGSTTAFNALIGVAVVLQQLGFAIPAALLMYRRRAPEYLPHRVGSFFTHFNLGVFGWACNAVTVAWAIIVLIFFNFPNAIPVTGLTMNYIPAVLGGMAIFGIINWLLHARKHYYGPVIDVEHFKEQTEGI
ncbi:hypothetical protein H2199_004016 [Coniosporium tulheliwenetii]|uniref:Uncharacterized protein n=1 Tax=Coniosporium tulheliwenetii TaxID=3383036 RepID=A0ACC2ZA12_9PEZI|nr:hypothetical protein H2199_004016 [Cladosporium sp. JES 115]